MKIGARLYILIGVLSLLLIAVGVLGLRAERETDDSLESIYNDRLVPAVLLSEMNTWRWQNIHELLLAQLHDPRLPASKLHEADHPVTKHTDVVEANRVKNDKLWEQYMATSLTPEEKKLAESFKAKRAMAFSEGLNPAITLFKARKFDDASLLITNKVIPLFNQAQQDFEALMHLQVDVAKDEKDKADANYAVIRNITITSIVGGILLALGIGYWIIRSITGRLTESVSAISTSATQIAATITQHERTARQQAADANQTSVTITELSVSSRQSAEQAANAAAVAEKATTATVQGGAATHQAVVAMGDLKDKIAAMADQILRLGEQTGQIGAIATLV
ncbi:MAG: MCP four helix bundle domain-containing protein, partial [Hydrogenophilales bacterium]|nr:MCP four helix bundle domain-containing protein [Hydrogenophilales bacterium]